MEHRMSQDLNEHPVYALTAWSLALGKKCLVFLYVSWHYSCNSCLLYGKRIYH